MNEENELRKYILKHFWVTLIITGFVEVLVSALTRNYINPFIERVINIDGLLNSRSTVETIVLLFTGLMYVLLRKIMLILSPTGTLVLEGIVERRIGSELYDEISSLLSRMGDNQTAGYVWTAIGCVIGVFILWIIPFVIAGLIFTRRIHTKIIELEENKRARDREFEGRRNLLISDMAHDIKTPITTVAGFSKALSDGTVQPEHEKEYLNSIYLKSMQVSDLVSLLFEYVKLDSEGYSLRRQKEDVCELVRKCTARLYPDFEEKGMQPEIDIPDDRILLEIDSTQLERAINNLLVNTIKYNPDGTKVMVSLERPKGAVVIKISDSGVFIDSEIARHLFDPFVRADESRNASGNGLGLSICKKIVKMHGGNVRLIQYKNPEEHGITKTFEIWLKDK